MSKRKGKLMIQRKAVRIQLPAEEHQQLFFFKIIIRDDEIESVEQIPDFPFEHTEDNGSLLSLTGWGLAIHVTWLPFKPAPESELRYKGYLSIWDDLGSRDPKIKEWISEGAFGFGHPEAAQVEWHTPRGDDA